VPLPARCRTAGTVIGVGAGAAAACQEPLVQLGPLGAGGAAACWEPLVELGVPLSSGSR